MLSISLDLVEKKMFDVIERINLVNLIDIKLLQEFQDIFANAMGVASITVDDKGPITKPSNFTEFCIKYVRGSEEGLNRCNNCDINWGKVAAQNGEPVIYDCHAGLTDFAVPIMVHNHHIATILGGQVLTHEPDESHFRKIAQELGVDEEEYIKALRKVKVVSKEHVESAVKLLFIVANSISEIAHKNLELIRKNRKEHLSRSNITILRSTLDPLKIKEYFVRVSSAYFNADRGFFLDFDSKTKKFLPIQVERLRLKDSKSLLGNEVEEDFPEFCSKLRKGKNVITKDLEKKLKRLDCSKNKSLQSLKKGNVKSDYGFPVIYRGELVGGLILHYVKEKHYLNSESLAFLNILCDQTGMALYQARLYQNIKNIAQREAFLRKIIEILRSSLNLAEIKKAVIVEIGEYFHADRCYFRSYSVELQKFMHPDAEYLASENIKSLLDEEPNQEALSFFAKEVKRQNRGFYPIVVNEDFAKGTSLEGYFKQAGIGADYATPIISREDEQTWLVLHYIIDPKLDDDDKKLIETIAFNMDLAFGQIRLYEIAQKEADKENLLRKFFETIRNSLDYSSIKKSMIEDIGKSMHADRCFFIDYDASTRLFSLRDDIEYKSSDKVSSFVGFDMQKMGVNWFIKTFGEFKEFHYDNLDEFIKKNNLFGTPEERVLRDNNIESSYHFPVTYKKQMIGYLLINYATPNKKLTRSDYLFIGNICEQAGIAFYQAEQFEQIKQYAKRQELLRVITEKIRSSLDIEETLEFICEEIVKLFDVQRVAVTEFFDIENNRFKIRKEYKKYSEVKGVYDIPNISAFVKYWGDILSSSDYACAIDDINEADLPYYFKQAYAQTGIKSLFGIGIKKGKDFWGTLVLSEYENLRHWSEDEKNLLTTIAGQIYIAINQAELYEKEKIALERERMSRNIIEILRSTLDKNIIKKLFVQSIGKFFLADKVFFVEFDEMNQRFLPIDKNSEYISDLSVLSFIDYDWENPLISSYIKILKEKREIKISDWEVYKNSPQGVNDGLLALYEGIEIKSVYNFPILYQEKIMGYFCLEFSKNNFYLGDEDIIKIRSICAQAGIALYHAQLYLEAQSALRSKGDLIKKVTQGIEEPVENIIETSKVLSQTELERSLQLKYLDSIIESCNELMELTKDLSRN